MLQYILELDSVAIATFVLCIVTIPLSLEALIRLWDARRLRSLSIYACRVRAFNPRLIVNAFGAHGFSEYWPIEADSDIEQALTERRSRVRS